MVYLLSYKSYKIYAFEKNCASLFSWPMCAGVHSAPRLSCCRGERGSSRTCTHRAGHKQCVKVSPGSHQEITKIVLILREKIFHPVLENLSPILVCWGLSLRVKRQCTKPGFCSALLQCITMHQVCCRSTARRNKFHWKYLKCNKKVALATIREAG